MDNNVENRIKGVMSAVFDLPADEINDESSPDTIRSWDSLKHINLILALEEEFNILLSDEEILNMRYYTFIKEIIQKNTLNNN